MDTPDALAAPPPPPDVGRPVSLDADTSDELTDALFSERQRLNAVLYRDRRSRIAVSRTLAHAGDTPTVELLTDLQAVLDAPRDSFAWVSQDAVPRSIRRMIDQLLCQQAPETRASYERRYGAEAARLLKVARSNDSAAALGDVLRRYRRTRAGLTALAEAAALAQDRGQFAEAARLRAALLRDPMYRQLAGAAGRDPLRAGSVRPARYADGAGADGTRLVAGVRNSAAGESVRPQPVPQSRSLPEWLYAFGAPSGIGGESASPPYPVPVWSRSFAEADGAGGAAHPLAGEHTGWVEQRQSARLPTSVAVYPIISGNSLVFRDYYGVTAVDVTSGQHLWTYRCRHALSEVVDRSETAGSEVGSGTNSLLYERQFAGNSVCGVLTADRHHVYTVDWETSAAVRAMTSATPPVHSRLLALPLDASGPDVQPAWTVGGDRGLLAGHVFLGPPLPARGSLYCMTEHAGELYLAALDPQDGAVRWLQPLAIVDRPIQEDEYRRRTVCMPSSDEGVIVCPTLLGAVVGVDAWTGELLWTSLCVDEVVGASVGRRPVRRVTEYADATMPSIPVVQQGRVVYLPPSSNQVFCLDLHSGTPLWSADRDASHCVATVRNGVVLLVGRRHCMGRALEDGRLLWKTKVGPPSGRGVVSGEQYLLPLSNGTLASLRIADGRLSTSLMPSVQRAHVDQVAQIGNLVAVDGGVVSVTPAGVQLFLPSDRLQTQLESAIAANPDDHALRLTAAEVAMVRGEMETARRHLEAVLPASTMADRAVPLLRDLLYYQLLARHQPADEVLRRLDELADSPGEEARLLTFRLRSELERKEYDAALSTAERLSQLDYQGLVPLDLYGEHRVAPAAVETAGLMQAMADMSPHLQRRYGPRVVALLGGRSDAWTAVQERSVAASVPTHAAASPGAGSGGLQETGRGAVVPELRPSITGVRPPAGGFQGSAAAVAAVVGELGMATAGSLPVAMDERRIWNADNTARTQDAAVAAYHQGNPWSEVQVRQVTAGPVALTFA